MTENMKKLLELVAGGGKCICSWAAAENTPTAASAAYASSAETETGNRFSNE